MKITIIGGGSIFTPLLLNGLIKYSKELHVDQVALLDIDIKAAKRIGNYCRYFLQDKFEHPIEIIPTVDHKEAISDSDYIIFTIRVGGLKARINDEKIPMKYGIFGDETTGAGGFSNSLRTIPVIIDYAKEIEKWAPNAWVILFTNPEGILTEAISKNSNVNVIGLCTAPFALLVGLAKYLKVKRSRISLDFVGLTHTGWVRGIFLDGIDIMPNFLKEANIKDVMSAGFKSIYYPIEIIKQLSFIPAHWFYALAGYQVPHWYYHRDRVYQLQKDAGETRGEELLKIQKDLIDDIEDKRININDLKKRRGHQVLDEPILSLISAIQNNKNEIHIVDIPNDGCLSFFDPGAIIEMPALINKTGAHPMPIPNLSPEVRGLMQAVKAYEELTIQAAVKGSYELALRALLAHPLIMSYEISKPLLDDILEANKKYLPKYWKL